MRTVTQKLAFCQRMMQYLQRHGVSETANRFHVCRKCWDGMPKSLVDRSRA